MIEAAVDRGIREMQEDPKRSVRKLADLGRQFSRGRFQKNFFDLSQTLLQDDNSPYYTILSRLTRETNHETLKKIWGKYRLYQLDLRRQPDPFL